MKVIAHLYRVQCSAKTSENERKFNGRINIVARDIEQALDEAKKNIVMTDDVVIWNVVHIGEINHLSEWCLIICKTQPNELK